MKYFYDFSSILLGQCFRVSGWRPGFNSPARQIIKLSFSPFLSFFSFCCNQQTFLSRLATFKITQILSPYRTSERKGMSTVERFIWVNLYSLDLRYIMNFRKWVRILKNWTQINFFWKQKLAQGQGKRIQKNEWSYCFSVPPIWFRKGINS